MKIGLKRFAAALTCVLIGTASACSDESKNEAAIRPTFDTFVNKSASVEDRISAASGFGVATQAADIKQLLAVVGDQADDERIRVIAMNKVSSTQIDDQIELFQRILNDPAESSKMKVEVCKRLHILTEFTYGGAEARDRLLALMRAQIAHPDHAVRECAMGYLATIGDEVAVSALTKQLQTRDTDLFSADQLISYLALDEPQAHFGTIRLYIDAEDEKTLAAAVRALGQDTQSQEKIRNYFQGKTKWDSVRKTASKVLARYDSEYPSYALGIVDNQNEDAGIRAQVILDLGTGLKGSKYPEYTEEIEEAIDKVKTDSPGLKEAVAEFQELIVPPSKNRNE